MLARLQDQCKIGSQATNCGYHGKPSAVSQHLHEARNCLANLRKSQKTKSFVARDHAHLSSSRWAPSSPHACIPSQCPAAGAPCYKDLSFSFDEDAETSSSRGSVGDHCLHRLSSTRHDCNGFRELELEAFGLFGKLARVSFPSKHISTPLSHFA